MVRWYDPAQLFRTGIQVVTALLVGRRGDYRLLSSLKPHEDVKDYSEGELWIDYVSDTGDGWEPTFAVAKLVASQQLTVGDRVLPRASMLIFGGDGVYPTASASAYEKRLIAPYRKAFADAGDRRTYPDVFAIPGNHDWYDGLSAFASVFLSRQSVAGLRSRQSRSYFALKLPGRSWLFALDTQLEHDIDTPQLQYFMDLVCAEVRPGDRVLLLQAEPEWIYRRLYDRPMPANVARLEQQILDREAEISVRLAGDLHHYRRHQRGGGDRPQHLITCGGGGAFLHPTHGPDVKQVEAGPSEHPATFALAEDGCYPSQCVSSRLAFWNLIFPWFNPKFGLATAALYTLLSWLMPSEFSEDVPSLKGALHVFLEAFQQLAMKPSGLVLVLAVIIGFVTFTDTHRRWKKLVFGSLHALSHLLAAMMLAWLATCLSDGLLLSARAPFIEWLFETGMMMTTGYLTGSVIMGCYLLLALNCGKTHTNEAFSALRLQTHKSFLRLRFDKSGGLTIYPIGLETPDDAPHLIEEPLVIPPADNPDGD